MNTVELPNPFLILLFLRGMILGGDLEGGHLPNLLIIPT